MAFSGRHPNGTSVHHNKNIGEIKLTGFIRRWYRRTVMVEKVKKRVARKVSRKRHEQTEMFDARGMKKKSPRGGKRPGAGRPPKGKRAGSPHKRRPILKARNPVHLVLRVVPRIGKLRR